MLVGFHAGGHLPGITILIRGLQHVDSTTLLDGGDDALE